jgi:glycerol kinase
MRPPVEETSALGSAYCAGLATGLWDNLDELKKNWRIDKKFEPKWDEQKREQGYKGWRKAVERTRDWLDR